MGLFTGLITLPLAPVRGVVWVAEQLAEQAERQLYDEATIRRELFALDLAYDEGEIDDEERARREDELLDRLAQARAHRAAVDFDDVLEGEGELIDFEGSDG